MKKAILNRKSVRTFTGIPISKEHEDKLMEYISKKENLIGVNGNIIKIHYVKTLGNKSEQIGTYGIINNTPGYLINICKNNPSAMLDCGYVFEKLVIFLEDIGLNTCWLGGTYNREKLNLSATLKDDEIIPIISPVGYKSEKRSFPERAIRKAAKSDIRKPNGELFFENDFNQPVKTETILAKLEYIRLAPSASNKQPWRVLFIDNAAHFYICRTPNYVGSKLGFDIQMVDIGIALSHYEMISENVTYKKEQPNQNLPNGYEYIISVF